MNKVMIVAWFPCTGVSTWWLMGRDPELLLIPTVAFSGIVSVLPAAAVAVLLGIFAKRAG